MITAGHCMEGPHIARYEDIRFVFNYYVEGKDPVSGEYTYASIGKDDVYTAVGYRMAYNDDDFMDWAIVRLDREVVGHEPAGLDANKASITRGTRLTVMGFG